MKTPGPRAIDLPELNTLVGEYLGKNDLVACVRVCRAWHASFVRNIWRRLVIDSTGKGPSWALVEDHKDLVYSLVLYGLRPLQSVLPPHFSRLTFLSIQDYARAAFDWDTVCLLVQSHCRTLKKINLDANASFSTKFWDAASACIALESLALNNVSLQHCDIVGLWQACLNLKELALEHVILPFAPFPESLRQKPLRRMRSLTMDSVMLPTDYETEWFELFPNLSTFGWQGQRMTEPLSIEKLLPAITTTSRIATDTITDIGAASAGGNGGGLWRNLKSLRAVIRTDHHLAVVLGSIDSLHELQLAQSDCSLTTLESLIRHHQSTITSLKFDRCQHVTSAMIQTILSKFPVLEELVAPVLMAHDVSMGEPWICTQLQTLAIRIVLIEYGKPAKGLDDNEYLFLSKDQENFYARLSTLKRLVYLDIALSDAQPGTRGFMLLDLSHPGFQKMMASLRNLQTLLFDQSQRPSLKVAERMVECASLSLTHVDGRYYTSVGNWISINDLLRKRQIKSTTPSPQDLQ